MPRARTTEPGRGPNLCRSCTVSSPYARSREREKTPAAGGEIWLILPKKCMFHTYTYKVPLRDVAVPLESRGVSQVEKGEHRTQAFLLCMCAYVRFAAVVLLLLDWLSTARVLWNLAKVWSRLCSGWHTIEHCNYSELRLQQQRQQHLQGTRRTLAAGAGAAVSQQGLELS